MTSVTFLASAGGDGSTVTDDSNSVTGLANGGHRTRFIPALTQTVAVASKTVQMAGAVAATANVVVWVSGTNYPLYASVISPINGQTYRRILAGSGTIDPSRDSTNWVALTVSLDSPAFTGTPTFNGEGNMPGYKNLVINGSFRVAQRGNVSLTSPNVFTRGGCDCFMTLSTHSTISGTIQQQPGAGAGTTSGYSHQLAVTSATGSGSVYFATRLERRNTAHLNGKPLHNFSKVLP